ncbi:MULTISPECIES: conjugal transfer protein TrbD [Campylobacter]|uniref:VirB3 family type IV secretion system protein n=2 Tax=Campylobacter fetus TaxID=196 RepID=A0A7D7Q511_CAMFE|nr:MULTISPECIES: conjugal transfer protein TrbD [Campylobacter]EAI3887400.1 conjugal transfer protein TrbD [Campylobacter fetus]KAA3682746.1 conjugal transfer protein TrbD [Campylobacter fetus subsp. fetus]KAA3685238.1 conjugal transfer protein TrbD [Campylobacter fetus subsp. fetus]MBC3781666.1 VirB3 family type IV secretion system protein [Campylobacter fetus subsp. fetus]MBC3783596.1 VirB3 family type IV secretion system protein [Campylobacter fetus subsp. venerealis]
MNEELKTADLYSALNKPNLIFGADRELILSVGVIAFALIFTGLNLISTIIGISLLVFSNYFLRLMAKADPLMRHVFLRQNKYRKFYISRSTPFVKE